MQKRAGERHQLFLLLNCGKDWFRLIIRILGYGQIRKGYLVALQNF